MGKINMGFFYGKLFNSRNRTFSLENGENFIEGTGLEMVVKQTFRPVANLGHQTLGHKQNNIYACC